jgi:flagellin-like hook-associated protein FlgL
VSLIPKALSLLVTALLLVGAATVGGEKPLAPSEIAKRTAAARRDLGEAVDNTELTVRRTAAFNAIAQNVTRQLEASQRLLDIQLELERSSRRGQITSDEIERRLRGITEALEALRERIAGLGASSGRLESVTDATLSGASELTAELDVLTERFHVVIRESKKLNRKARGFEGTGELP